MQANTRRDTRPEWAVRRLVYGAGLRYRVDAKPLPNLNRRADLVFRGPRVAVFIDGCFWHGCPSHCRIPATNTEYWSTKIAGNVNRDSQTNTELAQAGWTVLRFWEHEAPKAIADSIIKAVRG